ncbi:NAC domain-containing protein 83 [Apium graveolens]|uniref:NAC domain-containing protein 83 n=1 Tax=Apium graveolens TaxID=4045 RepID=UPI003D7B308C
MEKVKFVKNGVLRLLPGFRFHPTDQELVIDYLKRKVFSFPLPASIIPEVDLCKSDPWDLPGDSEQERYFFSTREVKYPNGNRSNRATASGYWKATGLDKKIVSSRGNQVVGMKKTLVFYRGKPPHGSRTDWIMHEYRLTPPQSQGQMENWVLCRIFLKKRGSAKNDDDDDEVTQPQPKFETQNINIAAAPPSLGKKSNKPIFYDFMTKQRISDLNLTPALSSSASSGITEASCNQSGEDHEESSGCNNTSLSSFLSKRSP